MMSKRWVVLIASVIVLGLAALLWRFTTDDQRQLDQHVRQALDRYEQAFTSDGLSATPTPPPNSGYASTLDLVFVEGVTVHPDGRTLTAEFVGAQITGPCGADYTARAIESEHAALLVIERHPHERGRICPMVGYGRQATVRLSRPLNGRVVLEATRGMPVPHHTRRLATLPGEPG